VFAQRFVSASEKPLTSIGAVSWVCKRKPLILLGLATSVTPAKFCHPCMRFIGRLRGSCRQNFRRQRPASHFASVAMTCFSKAGVTEISPVKGRL
jgi:hypothetical protein